ncbi:hypothetical protein GCM10010503_36920 [Streptomyces lucensis JCM 4490]|uniref:Uncharacterized protein n=1 Tax=Streptomyces lucensis JCM 4490 TaxID=1306176 RepID=A0A918J949_9ACTN|nr:DUF6069 family protein [Streptomyces lucensis]GGW56408.1 hypothetical protein GCM10010503_36920 [Streptomyces lucensis JCM 4490]
MTTPPSRPAPPGLRHIACATGGAVLATTLLWTVAHILGIELRVGPGGGWPTRAVSLPHVLGITLVVSLLASATRKGLDLLTDTDRASTIWTRLAVAVLLVSLTPLTYLQVSGGATAILALMHLAVAAVLIPLLAPEPPIDRGHDSKPTPG